MTLVATIPGLHRRRGRGTLVTPLRPLGSRRPCERVWNDMCGQGDASSCHQERKREGWGNKYVPMGMLENGCQGLDLKQQHLPKTRLLGCGLDARQEVSRSGQYQPKHPNTLERTRAVWRGFPSCSATMSKCITARDLVYL